MRRPSGEFSGKAESHWCCQGRSKRFFSPSAQMCSRVVASAQGMHARDTCVHLHAHLPRSCRRQEGERQRRPCPSLHLHPSLSFSLFPRLAKSPLLMRLHSGRGSGMAVSLVRRPCRQDRSVAPAIREHLSNRLTSHLSVCRNPLLRLLIAQYVPSSAYLTCLDTIFWLQ